LAANINLEVDEVQNVRFIIPPRCWILTISVWLVMTRHVASYLHRAGGLSSYSSTDKFRTRRVGVFPDGEKDNLEWREMEVMQCGRNLNVIERLVLVLTLIKGIPIVLGTSC